MSNPDASRKALGASPAVEGVEGRPSLLDSSLSPIWDAVRSRLERLGPSSRGRMRLAGLSAEGRFLLGAVLDRTPSASLDLAELEAALRRLDVGDDLAAALSALGRPVSPEFEKRRAARNGAAAARSAARRAASTWPDPEAGEWVEAVIRAGNLAGLDSAGALTLLERARAVLRRIDEGAGAVEGAAAATGIGEGNRRLSRVDLAATILGSSHALDWATREEAVVTRALELRHGVAGRAAWEAAGVDLDLVSAPVLLWGLEPATGPLAGLLSGARRLGIPLHLSQLALREYPLQLAPGTHVLVVENPRLVEAAVQRRTDYGVVALNGDPSGAAQLLVAQLRSSGTALHYHGDFDAAGLRICARMHRLGLVPWRMGVADYLVALANARCEGGELPLDPHPPPPTPWDPPLQAEFDLQRRIVHEERLLPDLLVGFF